MVTDSIDPIMTVELPPDWDLIPLGCCASEPLAYGINAPAIPFHNNHPCYIRITDITEDGQYDDSDKKSVIAMDANRYTLKDGDIVLARTGASTGKSYLYNPKDGKLVYAGFLIKASIDMRNNNPKFIVSQLKTKRYWTWVASASMRSGQPGINGKEYSSFLLPIAPKKEQDAIADTLLSFDTYIDNLTELIEKKRNIRDGGLEDLVSGRTRLDGYHGVWSSKPLGELGIFSKGQGISREQANSGNLPCIRYGEIYTHYNIYAKEMHSHISNTVAMQSMQIHFGDLLMTASGETKEEIGKCIVYYNDCEAYAGGDIIIVHPSPEVDPLFLSFLLNSKPLYSARAQVGQGDAVVHISAKSLKSIRISYPSNKNEQRDIAKILMQMDEEIEALENERDKIIQIREGAMDDLLTGRVRLKV